MTAYFRKSSVGCLHLEELVWLEMQTFFTLVFGFPGGVLYGSGLSCGFCLPPLQDPQGWVSGSTGALSRSPVCSKVGTTGFRVRFMVYDYFVTVMQLFSPLLLFHSASFFGSLEEYRIFCICIPLRRMDLIYRFFTADLLIKLSFTVISCEWILQMQTHCTFEACVSTMRTVSIKLYSSLSRLCAWHLTTKRPALPAG